ncbi:MAG: polysaccharide biosynthesis protein [Acidimicrobiales bacterium]
MGHRHHAGPRRVGTAVRRVASGGLDSAAWALGLWCALALRFEFDIHSWDVRRFILAAALAVAVFQLVATLVGGYANVAPTGSFEDVITMARATAITTVALVVAGRGLASPPLLPLSVIIAGAVFAMVAMAALRVGLRIRSRGRLRSAPEAPAGTGASTTDTSTARPAPTDRCAGEPVSTAEPGVGPARVLDERDLLGRSEIDTDDRGIAAIVTGRRVLVTGAGGSIGSELCRQLHRFAPASLVMVDRDESALHAVELSIAGRALFESRDVVVADIRDRERMLEVFVEHRPHVVFHAAALKHLPLLELYPGEGWKTNVGGTSNVLDAAAAVGVERFVNVSTDKAADPTSVLGHTKRVAERLTAHTAHRTRLPYVSVRFGNVLGSRGSVLEAFRSQAARGGPLTVTHPEATRYFMLIEEAVHLVLQAATIGGPGEALILDMGTPVRIDDVARRIAAESAEAVEVVYTGLRPGEKLHERLIGADEVGQTRVHPLISHVAVTPLDPALVAELQPSAATLAAGADEETATRPIGDPTRVR